MQLITNVSGLRKATENRL